MHIYLWCSVLIKICQHLVSDILDDVAVITTPGRNSPFSWVSLCCLQINFSVFFTDFSRFVSTFPCPTSFPLFFLFPFTFSVCFLLFHFYSFIFVFQILSEFFVSRISFYQLLHFLFIRSDVWPWFHVIWFVFDIEYPQTIGRTILFESKGEILVEVCSNLFVLIPTFQLVVNNWCLSLSSQPLSSSLFTPHDRKNICFQ